ncbi:MAG: C45 family peptidase [Planctomycetota bacterium]|nr:C45 family peptidase [Planctomycetota bacterium]
MSVTAIRNVQLQEAQVEPPVVCEGTPHQMGCGQGAAVRRVLATAPQTLKNLEAFCVSKPWWLPHEVFRRIAGRKSRQMLESALSEDFSVARERLHGIAAGAGVRVEEVYLLNALEAMMCSVGECTVTPPLGGCSAFAVRGAMAATGEPIVAHNFDYLPLIQPFYMLRESRPRDRLRSLEFTTAPMCGAVDGMNEAGLCITYNYAYSTDNEQPSGLISMAISEALQGCTTVTEAAEWIASRPRWGSGVLMLADAEGDIGSLELSATRTELRRPQAGEDRIFHSNCYSTDVMREVEVGPTAVFTSKAPSPLRGKRVLSSSECRNARFERLLASRSPLDAGAVTKVMSDHGENGEPSSNTICMHSDYWCTTACLQFFPRRRQMRVAYSSACGAQYEEFEL